MSSYMFNAIGIAVLAITVSTSPYWITWIIKRTNDRRILRVLGGYVYIIEDPGSYIVDVEPRLALYAIMLGTSDKDLESHIETYGVSIALTQAIKLVRRETTLPEKPIDLEPRRKQMKTIEYNAFIANPSKFELEETHSEWPVMEKLWAEAKSEAVLLAISELKRADWLGLMGHATKHEMMLFSAFMSRCQIRAAFEREKQKEADIKLSGQRGLWILHRTLEEAYKLHYIKSITNEAGLRVMDELHYWSVVNRRTIERAPWDNPAPGDGLPNEN